MFKPGDEVVCIRAQTLDPKYLYPDDMPELFVGSVYTVAYVKECFDGYGNSEGLGLVFAEPETHWTSLHGDVGAHCPTKFRKVQKRSSGLSLESFLTIKPGFEEPRRSPEKAKEKTS